MKKFWNFIRDEDGERILRLEGPVDEDNFWGDEVTPSAFREELEAEEGDVTVWINSPGGNVFAAAEIYTMLCDHKGNITVKIDAIAASAASVIAMAGDRVLMSPVAMLMIHDPMTIAMGNAKDMEKAISTLNEVKASIINAYQKKTGLSRNKISQLMEDETWMNAKKAVELGFADEILFAKKEVEPEKSEEEKDDDKEIEAVWQPYSTRVMGQRVLNWLVPAAEESAGTDEKPVKAENDTEDVEPPEAGMIDEADTEPEAVTDVAAFAEAKSEKPDEDETEEEESEGDESEEDKPDEDEDDEEEEPSKPKSSDMADAPVTDTEPDKPVIGMDGKTKDGAMPYDLLKKQLDFLK